MVNMKRTSNYNSWTPAGNCSFRYESKWKTHFTISSFLFLSLSHSLHSSHHCFFSSFSLRIVFSHQVQNEFVQTLQEAPVHIGDFTLFYRTASLRMKIERHQYHNGKSFTLKCEATFGHFTHLTRAKSARVFIVSTDDLTNQKLVNSKSAATGK